MAKPVLLIGIGTSGLRVIEYVQHFYLETTGRTKPDNVDYLYIETDENAQPRTIGDNSIKRIFTSLKSKETMINQLKNDNSLKTEWLLPAATIMEAGFGAGGLPPFGRLALWGDDNFNRVSKSIVNSWSAISNYDVEEADNTKPAVFLTGSLTGGTATGMFIDLAYLIKNSITNISEVYGLFLIPGRGSYRGSETIYCNTLSSIYALEYYNDPANPYTMVWPNGHKANFNEPPFELVQFISQDYDGDMAPLRSLEGLYKMGGLYLFLNIFGLRGKRLTRLGDAKTNIHIGNYGTFGNSAIQYPKSQIIENVAIDLSTSLFRRWVDPESYFRFDRKELLKSQLVKISNETAREFDDILKEAFDVLNAVNVSSGKIIDDLHEQVTLINRKQFTESSEQNFIYKLYSSQYNDNYYAAITNNFRVAIDVIIRRIHELVVRSTQNYENLFVTREQLKAIVKAIDHTINFWKQKKISGQTENWENLLRQETNKLLKNRYKYLMEDDNILKERLEYLLDLLKAHVVAHKIVDLKKSIERAEIEMKTFADSIILPTIPKVDKFIQLIRNTIEQSDDSNNQVRNLTLKDRKERILGDINDNTIPIKRIFKGSGFLDDCETATKRFYSKSGKGIPSKEVLLGDQSLYVFLEEYENDLNEKLYNEGISKFKTVIINYNCVEDADLNSYIKREVKEVRKIAERSSYAMLKINKDKRRIFDDSMYIPKMVIGENQLIIKEVISSFRKDNYLHFNDNEDGIFIKPELRNMLIFFCEHGRMSDSRTFNPLMDILYIDEVKQMCTDYAKRIGHSEEEWYKKRNPYIPYETFTSWRSKIEAIHNNINSNSNTI